MQPNHGTKATANGKECQPTECGSAGATISALKEPEGILKVTQVVGREVRHTRLTQASPTGVGDGGGSRPSPTLH